MHYQIARKNIPSQYIDLELTFKCTKNEVIELQLPSWRPGRYELANYAQKIRHLKLLVDGAEFPLSKITKDQWQFASPHTGPVLLQYQCHAAQMDAGGSWSDDENSISTSSIWCSKSKEENKKASGSNSMSH